MSKWLNLRIRKSGWYWNYVKACNCKNKEQKLLLLLEVKKQIPKNDHTKGVRRTIDKSIKKLKKELILL